MERAVRLRPAFLPAEHGSWSLAFEPLALGLLVAPSAGGAALAVAIASLFLARRPLKLALHPGNEPRPGMRRVALLLLACAAVGLAEAAALGGPRALWPLLLAAPLGGWFLFRDHRNAARSLSAELAGSAAFAVQTAAVASLAGWPARAALALAAVMAARAVPTVLTVRHAVRFAKGRSVGRSWPPAAAAIALALILLLAARSLAPWLTAVFGLLLLARAIVLAAPAGRGFSARQIGTTEAVIGAVYVLGTAVGYHVWPPFPIA